MSNYKRLTYKSVVDGMEQVGYTEKVAGCYCKQDMILCRLAELEDKIESGQLVEIPEVINKFAIVKYPFRKNKPLKVLEYYPCSYEILEKKIVNCYRTCDSMDFYVIEKDFTTKEAAEARLKELREGKK